MSVERLEHGGPVVPNDQWKAHRPPKRCRWGRKHRWQDKHGYYRVCIRCGELSYAVRG